MTPDSAVTLHDKTGTLISLQQWMAYQADGTYRTIATRTFQESGWRVETVWTGVNYTPGHPYSTIFESRVYRGDARQWRQRDFPSGVPRLCWSTLADAHTGHEQAARWLRWHIGAIRAAEAARPLAGI